MIYPSKPRPSFADEILGLYADLQVETGRVEEVREIQTALGLVAAAVGLCIVPAASQRQRPDDVCYRMLADEVATSPVIMSYRRNENLHRIEAIRALIRQMYGDNPPWLRLSEMDASTSG